MLVLQSKACTKCGEDKPYAEYARDAKGKDGYRAQCKACRSSSDRAHYEANREKKLAQVRSRYEANREAKSAYDRVYYRANRETYLAQNKEYHSRMMNNPEYRAKREAANLRRRRLMSGAKQEPYVREAIFERDNWTCGICGEAIDPSLRWPDSFCATIDHVIPLFMGGDDTPENVQASHGFCNFSKNGKVPAHFRRAVAEASRRQRA